MMNNDAWKPKPYHVSGGNGLGRWPANVVHDGSDEVLLLFPTPHGAGHARTGSANPRPTQRNGAVTTIAPVRNTGDSFRIGDSGSAARFFYAAKASKAERAGAGHATVKPLSLMRWLVRLVTPPGGVVVDPFLGSGTTMLACEAEGFTCWGAELGGDPTADDPAPHLTDIARRWHKTCADR
jgi:site-specific DNA-methyltransferase (adenine-specific)